MQKSKLTIFFSFTRNRYNVPQQESLKFFVYSKNKKTGVNNTACSCWRPRQQLTNIRLNLKFQKSYH
jgi:hypothetical protein